MKFLLVTLALVFQVFAQADTLSIPKIFEDGEVAEATDFNQNFEYLRDQIDSNASWLNRDFSGVKEVNVDCTNNQDALRLAYQANIHVKDISFYVVGTCFGALNYIPVIGADGSSSWGKISPATQSMSISSDRNATARVGIIPRVAHGIEKAELAVTLESFMVLMGVDLLMGVDDEDGVVFSGKSSGSLMQTVITGVGTGYGVSVEYGGLVQLTDVTISNVQNGLKAEHVFIRNKGSLRIAAFGTALRLVGGEWWDEPDARVSLGASGDALVLDSAAQAKFNVDKIVGGVKIWSDSTGEINYAGPGGFDADVQILYSNLTFITAEGSNPNYDISRFACNGMSFLNIDTIDVRNQGGNNCLDDAGWSAIINANFP